MSLAAPPPRVFIAYGHDSPEQMDRVLALCNRLREAGLDCELDRFNEAPPAGWPMWMELEIAKADFVVLVCSKLRRERLEREAEREERMEGSGSDWEFRITFNDLYFDPPHRSKYVPVFFESEDRASIPLAIRDLSFYDLGAGPGNEQLLARLLGSAPAERAPLEPRPARVPLEPPAPAEPRARVGFDDELIPNQADVYEAAQATIDGEAVAIEWSALNDRLFEGQSARRPELRRLLEERGVEQGHGLVRALEESDMALSEASRRRRRAAGRLPLMWRAMVESGYWGSAVDLEFRRALAGFLVLANMRAILSMAHVQLEGEALPLPAGLRPRSSFAEQFQLPEVTALFDASPPFWASDIAVGAESLYVWAPKERALAVYGGGAGAGGRFIRDFLVPQAEDHLIGTERTVAYDPDGVAVRKLRDQSFAEYDPLGDEELRELFGEPGI